MLMKLRVFLAGGTEHSPFDHLDSLESRYIHWACLAKFHICILKGFWQRSNNGKATKVSIVNHVPLRIETLNWNERKKKLNKYMDFYYIYWWIKIPYSTHEKAPKTFVYFFISLAKTKAVKEGEPLSEKL